jgi:putative membrane protein
MKRIFYTSAILGAAAFGLTGCSPTATNGNKAVINTNTNTAVATNSNANAAINSNAVNSSVNSNASVNMSKTLSSSDKEFMSKAAESGMAEVELAKIATTKAQDEAVRTFAQKMTFDHTKVNDELKAIASQKAVTLPTEVNSKHKQDIEKLSKLSGAAFDKEYIRLMIEDHEKDIAEFQKQADGGNEMTTKMFAVETLQKLKMHLGMFNNLRNRTK